MQDATGLAYGKIFDIIMDGVRTGNLEKLGLSNRSKRGIRKTSIPSVFPFFKTLTVREDIAKRLSEEARFKAYTCRSFYAGALFQIIIQRIGVAKLAAYVMTRPDLQEVIYG